jgi:hypothetical protein
MMDLNQIMNAIMSAISVYKTYESLFLNANMNHICRIFSRIVELHIRSKMNPMLESFFVGS